MSESNSSAPITPGGQAKMISKGVTSEAQALLRVVLDPVD